MFKKILISLVVIVGLFLVVVSTRPSDFKVERKATISAPAAAVFAQVNDFHNWKAWSPWDKVDPAMQRTFEGPSSGTGSIYRWVGDHNVGEGSMTITESHPSDLIRIDLEFLKPFKGSNVAVFAFKPEGAGTQVTWTMTGQKNFISKAIILFMSMDKMIGGQFEQGLTQMKAIAEAAPKK